MFTPGDIRNKVFERVKSGYNVDEVQPFLNELASIIENLQNENTDLQNKLEILAEKLEQYREDEDSLRAALIGAQKLGDSVVKDSKRKAEAIIAQATQKSQEMIAEAQASINKEAIALNKMQVEVAKFKSQILTLYKEHIEHIQKIPFDEEDLQKLQDASAAPAPKAEEPVKAPPQSEGETAEQATEQTAEKKATKIEMKFEFDNPKKDAGDPPYDSEDEQPPEDAEGSGDFPRKRPSKFGTLRFGDDYNLTRRE